MRRRTPPAALIAVFLLAAGILSGPAASADVMGPNLAVSQTAGPDPVLVGSNTTYTVTVANEFVILPADATNVDVTDTLPSNADFVSATPSSGACEAPAGGEVVCHLGTVSDGTSQSIDIVVTPTSAGTVTNVAEVESDQTPDPFPDDDVSSKDVQAANPQADLHVTQTDAPDPVVQGAEETYTVTIANQPVDPPSDATGVTVTDTLPTGSGFVSAVPSAGNCDAPSAGQVVCHLGTLASGSSATVTVKVTAGTGPSMSNTAAASSDLPDPDNSDDSSTESTTITAPSADLSVSQSDAPDPVKIGHQVTYTMTVHNGGPDPATGVSLVDQLPTGTAFNSIVPSQGTCGAPSGGSVTCSIGSLVSGANATVTLKVTPTSAPATITNDATVSGAQTDPAPANNHSTESTTVTALQADLRVAQTDSPDPVKIGHQLTYTVTVRNLGPDTATNVSLNDQLPNGATFRSAVPKQGSCSPPSAGTLTCSLGSLTSGAKTKVVVKVTPTNAPASISNQASVAGDQVDPNPANNSDTEPTTVNELQADLAVTQTDSPDPVKVGQQITYTVHVTNNGPDAANHATLTDDFPSNVAFGSATTTQGSCGAPSGGIVTCSLGTIESTGTATVTVKVTPNTDGIAMNDASAGADETDPVPGNNDDAETTTVNPLEADLSVTQTDSPDPVRVGQQLTYTVVVANNGPDATGGVSLSDTLPAGTSFNSATTTKGTCGAPVGGVLTCSIGSLASGAGATITINVTATGTGTPSNDVVVSGTEDDPVPGNNHDSESTTIEPTAADIRVTQTDSPDPVKVGQQVTYTVVVTNNGPDGATGVSLVDTLPGGTAFNSAVPSKGSCGAPSGGQVTCSIGALASGANATVSIKVTPSGTGTITNRAAGSANEADPSPGNNARNENTSVVALQADLRVTQTDSPDPAKPGQQVTYTVVVTNLGPDGATGVSLADDYPSGVSFDSATTTKGSCGAPSGGVVTCSIGSLASSASATVTVKVTPSATGTLTNQASVSGAEPDPVNGNNSSSTQTTVNDLQADLRVTQTDAPDPVTAGQNVVYTISVHNNGPDPATDTQAQDTLAPGTVFAGASTSAGSCGSPTGGQVTCALGTIANGGNVTVTITVSVTTAGSVTNTQDVSANETDGTPGNNHSTESTTVSGASCTIVGTNGNDTLTGTGGNDVMCGLGGDDILNGSGGDDRLSGGSGNDTLNGGDGNDQIFGGSGNDTMSGGPGTDLVRFDLSSAPVTVSLAAGTASGEGNDHLSGFEGVVGSPNNDHLTGDSGSNSIYGRGGNDDLVGGAGFDYVRYDLSPGGVSVDLAAGSSSGAEGHDTLTGFEGIVGSSFADSLHGNAGDNTITGRGGADEIVGGQGFDYVSYNLSPAGVTVNLPNGTAFGGEGSDTLSGIEGMIGSDFKDTFVGNAAANSAFGGPGNDELRGNDGNDSLYGEGGDDSLYGGPGNDYLDGGPGGDRLDGGGGQDTCIGTGADRKIDCESSAAATELVLPQAIPPS